MDPNNLYIDNLSGEEFEQYLATLFQKLGYQVELTKGSGDYGADLIISNSIERIAVQAKRYNGSVGISAVQEIVGAKNYYNADRCMVVTNNYFTKNAIELAKCNTVELIDRNSLVNLSAHIFNKTKYVRKYNIHIPLKEYDELLPQAIDIIIQFKEAKISLLQIRLKIGYNRAANIIYELEKIKLISERDSFGNRKILINYKILNGPINIILRVLIGILIFLILLMISALNISTPLLGSICVVGSIFVSIIIPVKLGNLILIRSIRT